MDVTVVVDVLRGVVVCLEVVVFDSLVTSRLVGCVSFSVGLDCEEVDTEGRLDF